LHQLIHTQSQEMIFGWVFRRIPDINWKYCRLKAELKKLRKMYEEQIKISREEFMMVHSKKVQKIT
jgi:hypothetical protein